MAENNTETYKVQFIKYSLDQGFGEYLVKVMAPGGITFHIQDRYSNMRRFQARVKTDLNLRALQGIPNFPPKKVFGNTNAEFLNNRMLQLQNFFNNFIGRPEVAKYNGLIQYFRDQSADAQSSQKIDELSKYLQRKPNEKSKPGVNGTADQSKPGTAATSKPSQQKEEEKIKEMPIVQQNQNFDLKNFEQECRKIVNEISDKLIDLGLEEQHSDYGQDLQMKQEKFRKEFSKIQFEFKSDVLNLPQGDLSNEALLEMEDPDAGKQFSAQGQDLNDINDIIHNRFKQQFIQEDLFNMPKKTKVINDDESDQSQEEFKADDLSDDSEKRRRRRNRRKDGQSKPKVIDDTYMPGSHRKLRACVFCKLVLNQEKWNKFQSCPNCPDSRGIEDTTDCFESLISLILPKKSWVAEWQQMREFIPGLYALAIRHYDQE